MNSALPAWNLKWVQIFYFGTLNFFSRWKKIHNSLPLCSFVLLFWHTVTCSSSHIVMEAVEGNQGNHMAINLLHPNICMYILHIYFCDLKLWFRGDIERRSEILVTLRVKGLKRVKFLSALLGKGESVII